MSQRLLRRVVTTYTDWWMIALLVVVLTYVFAAATGCASKPGVSQHAFSQTQLMPAADGSHETWIWWADGSMTSVKWGGK